MGSRKTYMRQYIPTWFYQGVGFTHCLYYGGPCLVAIIWNVDTHKDWWSKYKFIHDLLN